MKLARKWILVASLLLSMAMATTGTLAYLTDSDSETNVFTMGNVEIDLIENYNQGSTLLPGKDVPKEAYIKNTGNNDAWVWMTVAVPAGLDQWKDQAESPLHWDMLEESKADWDTTTVTPTVVKIPDENGKDYTLYTLLYKEPLTKGQETSIGMNKVYLDGRVDIAENGQMYFVKSGLKNDLGWNINTDGSPTIYVSAYAIQTEGFADVKAAHDAYYTQWGNNGNDYATSTDVDNVEDLITNLEAGKNVVVPDAMETIFRAEANPEVEGSGEIEFDAKGATVTLSGVGTQAGVSNDYGYLGFVPANGEDAVVENLNVTGSGYVEVGHYGESTGGDYTINNLKITNMTPTLKVMNGADTVAPAFGHYGNATMNNCVMTGVKNVEGYNSYDAGFPNKSNTTINGGEYGKIYVWSQAHVTINNAKVGTIDSAAITTNKLGMLTIGEGAVVDIINLVPGKYSPALTIEEGATVGKIVYNGTTYTVEEWLAR